MARITKTVKNKNNEDVEVYSDNCIFCKKEMMFLKEEADKIEKLFPFIKEKVEQGSPCTSCLEEKIKKENFKLFSEDEILKMKKIFSKE